jgi:hypothetical protein
MKNQIKPLLIVLTLLSTLNSQFSTAFAQGTAFTYQGRLNNGGSPASGTYNLTFTLFNTNTTGVAIAGPVTNNAVIITNGLFTVLVDFGSGVFTGATNWLEIGVETNGASPFATLAPRQQLTPTPYAIYAEGAGNLSGTLSASRLTSNGNTNGGGDNFFVGLSGNSMTSGSYNTANGAYALNHDTSGSGNTANGAQALQNNTSGSANTANGDVALFNNTSGSNNIALGYLAGYYITTGSYNIDIGNTGFSTDTNIIRIGSGQSQTFIAGVLNGNGGGLTNLNVSASQLTSIGNNNGGSQNFFVGSSGNSTTSGNDNTANGYQALYYNTLGNDNTANGALALYSNTSGSANTANGNIALDSNTSGNDNTANGYKALLNNNGSYNTANGALALVDNTSGSGNTANGFEALYSNSNGSNNIALGYLAGFNITTGSSNIDIGNQGLSTDSNIIRIGTPGVQTNTFIAGKVGLGGVTAPQQTLSLNGGLNIDQSSQNNGIFNYPYGTPNGACLSFGNNGGEGIASQRTSGANQYDLYFCTEFTPRITILAGGNVGIGITNPGALLQVGSATCNGTTWVNGSDRNSKEDFAAVNPRTVLEKVSALPITEWKYKVEADGTQHLGPMAQDFHAAFGLNGTDDKHIATVDEEGVALAAIQGLNQKLNDKDAEIQKLEERLEKLEQFLSAKNGGN